MTEVRTVSQAWKLAGIDHLALLALSYISINPNLLSSVKADKCSIYLSSVSALQTHMVSELYRRINTDSLVAIEQHQNWMYINCSLFHCWQTLWRIILYPRWSMVIFCALTKPTSFLAYSCESIGVYLAYHANYPAYCISIYLLK